MNAEEQIPTEQTKESRAERRRRERRDRKGILECPRCGSERVVLMQDLMEGWRQVCRNCGLGTMRYKTPKEARIWWAKLIIAHQQEKALQNKNKTKGE